MPFHAASTLLKWYPLLTLPPFIFMGSMLAKSGVADAFYQAIYYWMGRMRGGLAIGTIGLCALIAAMSGLNVAGTVIVANVALPSMLKRRYDKLMLTGIAQAGGALGVLIPPSIVFILYGIIAKVSIGHLWLAGIFPGLLLTVMYIAYIAIRCRVQPQLGPAIPVEERVGWREKFRSLKTGIIPIILIFVVLGLFFMGVTSIVECSAVGAVGSIVAAVINRKFSWKMLSDSLDETAQVTAMFMWIVLAAIMFGAVFDGLGAVHAMENVLLAVGAGKWGTMIMMQASFLLMGMVLDDTAMLLIVAPLYIPIVTGLGFSPVWFGVLYVINVQMAFLTPPFGYNLFIMKAVAPKEITLGDIYRSVIPFVGIQAVCLAILMVFPQIALYLPNQFFRVGG
jgi:tripartite ATP-independent transporter DctM subunit